MEPLIRDRLTLAAVLGAGIVVGVSSLYLYFKYNNCVGRELNHLTHTIENLRKDIEELKTTSRVQDIACPSTNRASSKNSERKERSSSLLGLSSSEENEEYYDVSEEGDMSNQSWANENGATQAKSGNLTVLFEELDKLFNGGYSEKKKAYERLLSNKEENISNSEFMWRLAKSCSMLSAAEKDKEKQKELIFEGVKYAGMALALDDNGETHKWFAILMAKTTDHVGVHDKLKNGQAVKEHLDVAIKLKPEDHTLYFLKGRWCFGVALLSWMERKVANTLFGNVPESTFIEARENFMQVEKMKPGEWIDNMLYIAKCYIQEKKFTDAISWLDKAAQIPGKSEEDNIALKEIASLQAKYKKHRQ